jgi:hypothetical protein
MSKRLYVGKTYDQFHQMFWSEKNPTWASHGSEYSWVIGPFRSKAGAEYFISNPLVSTVGDAERLSKKKIAS